MCSVRNLSIILQDADIQLPDHTLEDSQRKRLAQITHTCEKILQELEREIGKHRVVTYTGTAIHKRVTCAWKRVSWNKEDLSELRDRLAFQMSLLQAYLDGISRYKIPFPSSFAADINDSTDRQQQR